MKIKLKSAFISIFLTLVFVLNACIPQAAPTASAISNTPTAPSLPVMQPTPTLTASPSILSAMISEITGKVEIKQAVQDAFTPANANSFLDANGQVQTGDDGRARLDLSTGTIIRIAPASLFTLISNEPAEENLKTRFKLTLGKIFIILNGGTVDVETPTGTAAVRGSYMTVNYDEKSGEVRITCLEGNCSLTSSGGSVQITAGQTAVITGIGQPPQVGEMSDQDIQDWLNNNPEAAVVVSALVNSQPTQSIPTEVVLRPPLVIAPPVVVKKTVEPSEPQPTTAPTIVQTAMPTLTPTVVIGNIAPAASVVGEPLTIAISVTPVPSGPIPTGVVTVLINETTFCTAVLDSGGSATCVGSFSDAGSYSLVAEYYGDSNYLIAQSASWTGYVVNKASTTTTITSQTPNPSLVNDVVTFTATVDNVAPGTGLPTGSVTFTAGTYSCIATAAPWTCDITFTTSGVMPVTASYSGDANFNNSNSTSTTQSVTVL